MGDIVESYETMIVFCRGGDETECVVKPPRFSNFVISDIVNCIIPLCESSIATGK